MEFLAARLQEGFAAFHRDLFDRHFEFSKTLVEAGLVIPALEQCLKCSHVFNVLDASGGITVEPNGAYAYVTNGTAGATKRIDAISCHNPGSMSIVASVSFISGLGNPTDIFYDSTAGDRLVVVSQEPKIQIVSITR